MNRHTLLFFPSHPALAERVTAYYQKNRSFFEAFDPKREESFFTVERQKEILAADAALAQNQQGYRFYFTTLPHADKILGFTGINNVVRGAFQSAFLSYKLDKDFLNQGIMTQAVEEITHFAFTELRLHRLEANIMPRNKASLRVVEKNGYINEGLSKEYLYINGVWEDHVHMVKINHHFLDL